PDGHVDDRPERADHDRGEREAGHVDAAVRADREEDLVFAAETGHASGRERERSRPGHDAEPGHRPAERRQALAVEAVHGEDGHRDDAHRADERREERIVAALERGHDREQEHRDARREAGESRETLQARDHEERDDEERGNRDEGGQPDDLEDRVRPLVPVARHAEQHAVARTKEAVRVQRAPSAPLEVHDLAAIQALVELHLHALEWLRHPAARGRPVAVLEHLGHVRGDDIRPAAFDEWPACGGEHDEEGERETLDRHEDDNVPARASVRVLHGRAICITLPNRAGSSPMTKSSARLYVSAGNGTPASSLPSQVTALWPVWPGAMSTASSAAGANVRTTFSPSRPLASTRPESGPRIGRDPAM